MRMLVFALLPAILCGQSGIALQEKCSNAALAMFKARYQDVPVPADQGKWFWTYVTHYNKKRDRCFMLVTGKGYAADATTTSIDLIDIFENKQLASYTCSFEKDGSIKWRTTVIGEEQFNIMNGFNFNHVTKKWDIPSKDYANSKTNPFTDTGNRLFDSWVKPYMNE